VATSKSTKPKKPKRFLSKGEVMDKVPLSYPTIWKKMQRGEFPRPRVSGTGTHAKVLWWESDIDAWMEALPQQTYQGDSDHVQLLGRRLGTPNRRKKAA
jgi:predicted DNA-binding transcriptional regulator AlpA